jgi:hypothetical protein
MAAKTGRKVQANQPPATQVASPEIVFKCRFCGESKPLVELVMIRHYYPPLAACGDCFKINNNLKQ